jgi:hypothetical protein
MVFGCHIVRYTQVPSNALLVWQQKSAAPVKPVQRRTDFYNKFPRCKTERYGTDVECSSAERLSFFFRDR